MTARCTWATSWCVGSRTRARRSTSGRYCRWWKTTTGSSVPSAPSFDLVVAGGRVVDPAGAGVLDADVGVLDGRVAAVEAGLVGSNVVDASGLLVVPGLIDLHTHVLPRFTYWGIDP